MRNTMKTNSVLRMDILLLFLLLWGFESKEQDDEKQKKVPQNKPKLFKFGDNLFQFIPSDELMDCYNIKSSIEEHSHNESFRQFNNNLIYTRVKLGDSLLYEHIRLSGINKWFAFSDKEYFYSNTVNKSRKYNNTLMCMNYFAYDYDRSCSSFYLQWKSSGKVFVNKTWNKEELNNCDTVFTSLSNTQFRYLFPRSKCAVVTKIPIFIAWSTEFGDRFVENRKTPQKEYDLYERNPIRIIFTKKDSIKYEKTQYRFIYL